MFKEEFNKVAGAASAKNQLLKNVNNVVKSLLLPLKC